MAKDIFIEKEAYCRLVNWVRLFLQEPETAEDETPNEMSREFAEEDDRVNTRLRWYLLGQL